MHHTWKDLQYDCRQYYKYLICFCLPPPFFSKLHSTCNLVLGGRTPSLVSVVFIALLIFFDFALSFLFGTEHSNIIIWRMGEGVKGMQTQKN